MREDAHVDALGLPDQAVKVAAPETVPPAFPCAVSHEDLRDSARARELHDRFDRVFAVQGFDLRSQLAGDRQIVLLLQLSAFQGEQAIHRGGVGFEVE